MGPVLLILALAVIIWMAVLIRQTRHLVPNISPLILAATLFLVIASVFGAEFLSINAGPIPITIDRLMLGGLVVLFVVQVVLGYERIREFNRTDVLVLSLLLLMTCSTFSHNWQFLNNLPASRLLFFNMFPVTLYFLVRNARLQIQDLKFVTLILGAFGVYLALTAVAEVKAINWAVFPRYISDPTYDEFFGRARGPFLNPVSDGIFMIVCFAGILTWWPPTKGKGKFLIVLLTPLFLAGVYATLTRSVWLSFAMVAFVATLMVVPRRWHPGLAVCSLLAGLLFVMFGSHAIESFKRDKFVSEEEMQQSASLRPLFAVIAGRMFQDRPLLGCGFGQYAAAKRPYLQDPTGKYPLALTKSLMQHNLFLSYLTELGLIGLTLLLLLLINLLAMAMSIWRNRRRYLVARQFGLLMVVGLIAHTVNGMFHDVSITPMSNILLYFFAGLTTNLYTAKHLTEMSDEQIAARIQHVVIPLFTGAKATEGVEATRHENNSGKSPEYLCPQRVPWRR